jgi:hypothetical protein
MRVDQRLSVEDFIKWNSRQDSPQRRWHLKRWHHDGWAARWAQRMLPSFLRW